MAAEFPALEQWNQSGIPAFDAVLGELITGPGVHRDARLVAAMRHAVLAGGKRLRPYLVLESCRLFGLEGDNPLRIAAALELVHCYSLIHDDLPSMDNDMLRRGKPTAHIAFDEATAILAGDALLTLSFAVLADRRCAASPATRVRLISALAEAAGIDGMVGGQMLDLAAEGRFAAGPLAPAVATLATRPKRLNRRDIEKLQGMKTGALILFAAEAGALLTPKTPRVQRQALTRYGKALGLAFQIRDDLIDIEGDAAAAGKATGKDTAVGKATFVSLLGIEGARQTLAQATAEGHAALAAFGAAAGPLIEVLDFNQHRTV